MNVHQLRKLGINEMDIFYVSELWRDWLRQERRDFIMILQQDMSEFARG